MTPHFPHPVRAALIDMDGVLYDSMPWHARAWRKMFHEIGVPTDEREFFLYEGMTGQATVDTILLRETGRHSTPREARDLYRRKAAIFADEARVIPMPGADAMLRALEQAGVRRVLVTGSAQNSLLSRLDTDYPGAFETSDRVTAMDVTHGKPDPEPYLKGLAIADTDPAQTIVIENAPLGVRAGKAAGLFTVAVTTGPIERKAFVREGADMIFSSMPEFAEALPKLLTQS